MPKISIITTTYKHKDFIGYTIQSILDQTFSDWELLIGDDSPDDATWDVIQEYVKKYPNKIKARHHTPNKGIIDNMNFLFGKISKETEYIALLEGDDMYTKTHLQNKIDIFRKYKNLGLVYNNLDLIDQHNTLILSDFFGKKGIKYYQNTTIDPKSYIYHKTGPICSFSTVMIKKNVFDSIKLVNVVNDDKSYTNPDFDFYFKICQQFKVYGIHDALTLYRRHSGNLSGAHLKPFTDLEKLIDYYLHHSILSPNLGHYKLSWINTLKSISCIYIKDKKNGFKYFSQSLILSPWSNFIYKIGNLLLLLLPNFLLTTFLEKNKIK